MSDKHFVGLDLVSFEDKKQMRPVSRVTFLIDGESSVTAGDDTGLEIVANNPHATQAMADTVLARLKGYQYHAFEAGSANLDPAAELGDGITAGGAYGFIGRLYDGGNGYPGVVAPGEAELEDEYPSAGPMTREFNRKIAQTRSSITKTAEQIRLEVAGVDGKVSAIQQYIDSITLSVSNGSTSSTIALKAGNATISSQNITFSGFVTFTGLSGGTTTIDGACIKTGTIDADRLNLTGAITFNDLSVSLYNQVNNSITSSQARTLINSTLVSSPNIAGANFWNYEQTAKMNMVYNQYSKMAYLALFTDGYSTVNEFVAMGLLNTRGPAFIINPFPQEPGIKKPTIEMNGSGHMYAPNTGFITGNWNFSSATITGLNIASLNLSPAGNEPVAVSAAVGEDAAPSKVALSDDNGRLKIEVGETTWYLDAAGLHQ